MARTFGGGTPEFVSAQAAARSADRRAMRPSCGFLAAQGPVAAACVVETTTDQRRWLATMASYVCPIRNAHYSTALVRSATAKCDVSARGVLRVSARRFRRGSAARRTGEDTRKTRSKHDRHRCNLSRRRSTRSPAERLDCQLYDRKTTEKHTRRNGSNQSCLKSASAGLLMQCLREVCSISNRTPSSPVLEAVVQTVRI